jgi:hypothetical protein
MFTWKIYICGRVLKSVTYVELVHKAADEIIANFSFKSCGVKEANELVVTSNKLIKKIACLFVQGIGSSGYHAMRNVVIYRTTGQLVLLLCRGDYAGYLAPMSEFYRTCVAKPLGHWPLGKPRSR